MEDWRTSLAESWEHCRTLLHHYTKKDCGAGIESLAVMWSTKYRNLGHLFDLDGRRISTAPKRMVLSWSGHGQEQLWSATSDFARALAGKDRFAHIAPNYSSIIYWLKLVENFAMCDVAANNTQIAKQTIAVSTWLNQEFDKVAASPQVWRTGTLKCLSYEQRASIKEFIQITFSRMTEILRPMVTDTAIPIVISINPLDLLLCSLHTASTWGSCYVLSDYRTQVLGFLGDGETAIAFTYQDLKSIAAINLDYPVKLWRQFIYIYPNEQSAMGSHQLPNVQPGYAAFTRRFLAEMLSPTGEPGTWYAAGITGSYRTTSLGQSCEGEMARPNITTMPTTRGYPTYLDTPTYVMSLKSRDFPAVKAGVEAVPCLVCNRQHRATDTSMQCRDCYDKRLARV